MNYIFELPMSVRTYEVDVQGVVNNAVYQQYFEHTRNEFLKEMGFDFALMHDEGKDFVVAKVEIRYKMPLRMNDEFLSCLNMKKEGKYKYVFTQDILLLPKKQIATHGIITVVSLVNGRLGEFPDVDESFKQKYGK